MKHQLEQEDHTNDEPPQKKQRVDPITDQQQQDNTCSKCQASFKHNSNTSCEHRQTLCDKCAEIEKCAVCGIEQCSDCLTGCEECEKVLCNKHVEKKCECGVVNCKECYEKNMKDKWMICTKCKKDICPSCADIGTKCSTYPDCTVFYCDECVEGSDAFVQCKCRDILCTSIHNNCEYYHHKYCEDGKKGRFEPYP
jgi:hypothetical protein